MPLHNVLIRQLHRLGLEEATLPTEVEKWQTLLAKISNSYHDADQERYLIERSMEISSRELVALNEKLESAQHIARLGYWTYEPKTQAISWSKEFYTLLDVAAGTALPDYPGFLQMIHERDQQQFIDLVNKGILQKQNSQCEIKVRTFTGGYRWFEIVSHILIEENNTQLTGIAIDITTRKEAEAKITSLNEQLLTSARRAGMAEVATSILHNVGNILNSANVSLDMLKENIAQAHYNKLFAVTTMLKEHGSSLRDYLTQDEKGKLIPEYLIKLSEVIAAEHQVFIQEVGNLTKHIGHIKEIVAMQQAVSGASGLTEKIFLPEAIDLALEMVGNSLTSRNIKVTKNFASTPFITVDKAKLLQILVNLIQNAKDALQEQSDPDEKRISFGIKERPAENQVVILVEDNGIGVAEENSKKIFSFGFTTKKEGHGFGLHSSALAAKELGGSLSLHSEGLNKGAMFCLILPSHPAKSRG